MKATFKAKLYDGRDYDEIVQTVRDAVAHEDAYSLMVGKDIVIQGSDYGGMIDESRRGELVAVFQTQLQSIYDRIEASLVTLMQDRTVESVKIKVRE